MFYVYVVVAAAVVFVVFVFVVLFLFLLLFGRVARDKLADNALAVSFASAADPVRVLSVLVFMPIRARPNKSGLRRWQRRRGGRRRRGRRASTGPGRASREWSHNKDNKNKENNNNKNPSPRKRLPTSRSIESI